MRRHRSEADLARAHVPTGPHQALSHSDGLPGLLPVPYVRVSLPEPDGENGIRLAVLRHHTADPLGPVFSFDPGILFFCAGGFSRHPPAGSHGFLHSPRHSIAGLLRTDGPGERIRRHPGAPARLLDRAGPQRFLVPERADRYLFSVRLLLPTPDRSQPLGSFRKLWRLLHPSLGPLGFIPLFWRCFRLYPQPREQLVVSRRVVLRQPSAVEGRRNTGP